MQYICGKTRDEGSKYAARQEMRVCNNNNMCNPSLHLFYYGVTHIIIVACPHPLFCCIYTAHIPCFAAYILDLFLYFLALSSLHPSTLNFNGNVFTPLFIYIHSILNVFTVFLASPVGMCYTWISAELKNTSIRFESVRICCWLCVGVRGRSAVKM